MSASAGAFATGIGAGVSGQIGTDTGVQFLMLGELGDRHSFDSRHEVKIDGDTMLRGLSFAELSFGVDVASGTHEVMFETENGASASGTVTTTPGTDVVVAVGRGGTVRIISQPSEKLLDPQRVTFLNGTTADRVVVETDRRSVSLRRGELSTVPTATVGEMFTVREPSTGNEFSFDESVSGGTSVLVGGFPRDTGLPVGVKLLEGD